MGTWKLHGNGTTISDGDIVAPDERLSWPLTIGFGAQHVVAMFGILATGLLLAVVGAVVLVTGIGWIDGLMPPVVSATCAASPT